HTLPLYFSFLYCFRLHPDLHSFPTRRSSDLYCLARSKQMPRKLTATSSTPWAGRTIDLATWRRRSNSSSAPSSSSPRIPPSTIIDRKSTRLNSSHLVISYAVFCLKKKKKTNK